MRTAFFAVISAAASLTGALQQPPPLTAEEQAVVRLIQAGDDRAVIAAGQSGNRAFVPYLRQKLHDPALGGTKDKSALGVQVALIKLEDADTMQEFWCEAITESTNPPLESFQFVGGWYSIRALDAVLSGAGDSAFRRAVNAARPTDLSFGSPRFLAVTVLEKIAPTGPNEATYRGPDGYYAGLEREAQGWHKWITDHRDELSRLKPIGEGVDLTEKACKNGKPVRRR